MSLIIHAARTCKKTVDQSDTENVVARELMPVAAVWEEIGEKDLKLVTKCIDLGHESILEHVNFTFEINFSRVAHTQLLRHRIASYSAESARAVEIGEDDEYEQRFFIPPTIARDVNTPYDDATSAKIFWDTITICLRAYTILRGKGIPVEDARYILPMALVQPIVCTMNLRQWRHVIYERTCVDAQYEIRCAVKEIRRQLQMIHPIFVHAAEKFGRCAKKEICGKCLTNWEGMEEDK